MYERCILINKCSPLGQKPIELAAEISFRSARGFANTFDFSEASKRVFWMEKLILQS